MFPMRQTRNWRSAYLFMLSASLVLTFWSISIAFYSSAVVVQFMPSPTIENNNFKLPNQPPKAIFPGRKSVVEKFDRKPSYPWRGDPQCQHYVVQFSERESLPKWPLTSFPGSGVTWTRQLIEGVTGIYTGSVYMADPSPVLSSQINGSEYYTDDPLCGCTIVDKDHEATITTLGMANYFELLHRQGHGGIVHQQYDKRGVLLLRNPMDVVFTYRDWLHGGKVGKAPPEAFRGPEWDATVDYVAYAWADHAIRWIEQIENGTVLFYERLMGKTASGELKRFLQVVDFHPVDPVRMRCTLDHRNRTDHKRLNKTRKMLEPNHRMKLMKAIHRVQQSLRRKGWPRLPIYLYDVHSLDGNI
ncbi:WSC domain-containing protein 1-like [Daphnia pulicaria]|uniref:WSC domain-containing protein 1-like n=1 Tax=Daphnia pulicaria TaxID=35523 RepID=UPI001EE9FDDC|nr:WSC domain-containing protein 1-like [Daphnia pulicaria]